MTERLWPFKELERFLRYEDPEVRYWAADRLARHHPREATPLLAPYLFDDHDLTPELVATHLGQHGGGEHIPLLTRGVRTLQSTVRIPAATRTASNAVVKFEPRSRIMMLTRSAWSPRIGQLIGRLLFGRLAI